ncbi:MAG: zf-HC2 domain-containing protein [Actinomycetota bacterium]
MSSTFSEWHADDRLIERYAAGVLDPATAASVEAHVLRCRACRTTVAGHAPAARLALAWSAVTERIDDPSPGLVERSLRRLGLTESDARLAACAPAMRLAWLAALVAVLLFCVVAAAQGDVGPNLFMVLAPALPSIGVGLAYGPWTDGTYEVGRAAPYSAVRLLFLRTAVVLAVTFVLSGAAGLVVPGHRNGVVLWLIPAIALVTGTLALSAWLPPAWAASVTGGTWLAAVVAYWKSQGSVDPIFGPAGQVAAGVVFLVACLAIDRARRVHAYDVRRFL